jgi:tripartite-type tricarboxylate transporter receptor subunit TctC
MAPLGKIILVLQITLALGSAAHAQDNFYQGKTIRLIVGSAPGGGYDLWPRMMIPYFAQHIPGKPDIIVQNMPGAGSVIGANYLYNVAKPDGLTLGAIVPAIYFDQLIGRKEVQFDYGKFSWIGSPEQNDILHFIRADTPYRTIEDLRGAKEPPRCGSSGTGTTGHYFPRLLEEIFGVKTKIVEGYPGGSEIDLAVERGEVVCWSPVVATFFGREPYLGWNKRGFVRVVLQTGKKRDPRLADVPTIWELMDRYKTPETGRRLVQVVIGGVGLGRPILTGPGVPPERLKILRQAYARTLADPALLAEAKKRNWDVDPIAGEQLESLAKEVIAQPPQVIERMKWVLGRDG